MIVIINIVLLIFDTFSYVFLYSANVPRSKAEAGSFSLRICPATGSCTEQNYYRLVNSQCVLVSLYPSDATANDYATLAECEKNIGQPTPTPSGVTLIPGLALPGLIVGPYKEKDIFTTVERGYTPYVKVEEISGKKVFEGEMPKTTSREPEFIGSTNLKNAVIFIGLSNAPNKVHTVFADDNGKWEFLSPRVLEAGDYTLFLTAMSPVNPYFQAEAAFTFRVIPISAVQPSPVPSVPHFVAPTPGVFPKPTPQIVKHKTLIAGERLYGIQIRVWDETKNITPGEIVRLYTKISRIFPKISSEEAVPVHYYIVNPKGRTVFDKTENIMVKDALEINSRLTTSPSISLGEYRVFAEIRLATTEFISTDTFEVRERIVWRMPGMVITEKMALRMLWRIFWLLLALLAIFIILLYLEHQKCKKAAQITERDLYKDKDIV